MHQPQLQSQSASTLNPNAMENQCLLALALYDNAAEAADELAFRKGDILTVLEHHPNGLVGWWLCSLRDRLGICPANRLRMLGHVQAVNGGSAPANASRHVRQASDPLRCYGAPSSPSSQLHLQHQSGAGTPMMGGTSRVERRFANPNKVIIPLKIGDVYQYISPEPRHMTPSPTVKSMDSSFDGGRISGLTYDTPRSHQPTPTVSLIRGLNPAHQQGFGGGPGFTYDIPRGADESYDVPRSHHQSPLQLLHPDDCNTDYDVPRGGNVSSGKDFRCYEDAGGSGTLDSGSGGGGGDVSAGLAALAIQHMEGAYDVPQSLASRLSSEAGYTARSNRSSCASLSSSSSGPSPFQSHESLTPSLSLSSLGGGNSSSNRSSLEHQPHEMYDIPRVIAAGAGSDVTDGTDGAAAGAESDVYDVPTPTTEVLPLLPPPPAFLPASTVAENVYDVPPQVTRDLAPLPLLESDADRRPVSELLSGASNVPEAGTELPLELHAAMDMLVVLQQNVQAATNRLFTLVEGRRREFSPQQPPTVGARSYDLKLACTQVLTTLQEFAEFANGALVNASRGADQAVYLRLRKLQRPLHDATSIVGQTCNTMEEHSWALNTNGSGNGGAAATAAGEALEQLVACTRTLGDDVRQVACFIQGNSTLIFKKASASTPLVTTATVLSVDANANMAAAATSHSPPVSLPPKNRERPLPPTPNFTHAAPPATNSPVVNTNTNTNTVVRRVPPSSHEDDRKRLIRKRSTSTKEVEEEENIYENDDRAWVDDYEYVSLESKESVQARSDVVKAALPEGLRQSFDDVLQESLVPVDDIGGNGKRMLPGMMVSGHGGGGGGSLTSAPTVRLDANDRQLVGFYEQQLEKHGASLNKAIQYFLLTVEGNHPPKVFVDHGKFVILGAHKLVFIGDTLHHHAVHPDLRQRSQRAADDICDAMKGMVQRVKAAALQFPSVLAVQEMVDSVVDVSHAASELKAVVQQYARL